MTSVSQTGMNRRHFLKSVAALAGGVALLGSRQSSAAPGGDMKTARWALLSDTHIPADPQNNYRGFYPYQNLQKIIPQITAEMPDGLIITGDLARLEGLPGDYANAVKLLSPVIDARPVCVGLGNHDHRTHFLAACAEAKRGKQAVQGKHVVVMDAGPVRLIVLDSLLYVNKVAGLLGRAQRQWLASYLERNDDKPVLLFFHHPPSDADGDLLDTPRLLELIRPAAAVKGLVFGHSHTYRFAEMAGIHCINLPASGYNFSNDQPVGWVEAHLTADGGAFHLHATAGHTETDGQVTTLRWRT
jgi:3',5'-cyclic AMP phosphodiesterase CpdA